LLLVATLPLLSFPLSWLPQQVAHYRFMVTSPIAAVVLAGLLLAIAHWALRSKSPVMSSHGAVGNISRAPMGVSISNAILWPSILLLLSWLISVRFSQRPYISIGVFPSLLGNLAVFLLATRVPAYALRKLLWVWLFAASFVAMIEIARLWSEAEVISTIGNRNFLGAYLAASIALGIALWDKRATVVCALLLAAMYFCRSRGAWLAPGIAALLWFFLENRGRPAVRVVRRIIVMTLVIATVFLGFGYAARAWRTEVRPMIWKSTLTMIAERPFFGHGLGSFVAEYPRFRLPEYFLRRSATNITDHAHNELLEIAAEQGLVGLVATLWLWGVAFCRGVRSLRADDQWKLGLGILGATTVLLMHGMLDVGLRYPPDETLLWLLLGLLAGKNSLTGDEQAQSGMLSTNSETPLRLHSSFTRAIVVAVCLLGGIWIAFAAVVRPVMAGVWERRARMAEESGKLVEAEADARRSLSFQPFRITARYFLAGILAGSKKSEVRQLAVEECLFIEELSPDYADVTYNLGLLYTAQGQPQKALPYLRRAAEINPYNVDRQLALASVYAQLGRMDSACAHIEKALRLDPQNVAARNLLAELKQKKSP